MRAKYLYTITACLIIAASSAPACADLVFNDFQQDPLAAQATFYTDGSNLLVALENTSTYDVLAPEDVLTGVFFTIDNLGANTLVPERAVLYDGSVVLFAVSGDGTDSNGEIGREYGFRDNLTGVPSGATMVIAAVGLNDILGPHDLFPGENLWASPNGGPGGLGYGILSAGDDPADGNARVTGGVPLVSTGVLFELSGLPDGFTLEGNVRDVMYNYSTSFHSVPDPSSGLLVMLGLTVVGCRKRRFARSHCS